MKENSREEDIEELKRLLYRNELSQYGKRKLINYYEQQEKDYKIVLQENEYMHNELDKQQTKINKYAKENEELKNQEATQRKINELLVQRYSNSISKQKVKDKIEKLKAQYKTALEKNSTEAFILKCQITILQELIKESEE